MQDFSTREGTIEAIINECEAQGLRFLPQIAYVLATVQHEANNTFKPVKEAYWLSEAWRLKHLPYSPWYGRGYVQLTWRQNYVKFAQITGEPLDRYPDLALRPNIACFILVFGFKHGSFTRRKLEDFVAPLKRLDFYNARRCVNGTDKADKIAGYARTWLDKLLRGVV